MVSYGFLWFLMVSPIFLTCFPHFVISGARDFGDAMPRRAQFRWRRRLPPGALWCSLGTCGGGYPHIGGFLSHGVEML